MNNNNYYTLLRSPRFYSLDHLNEIIENEKNSGISAVQQNNDTSSDEECLTFDFELDFKK